MPVFLYTSLEHNSNRPLPENSPNASKGRAHIDIYIDLAPDRRGDPKDVLSGLSRFNPSGLSV